MSEMMKIILQVSLKSVTACSENSSNSILNSGLALYQHL